MVTWMQKANQINMVPEESKRFVPQNELEELLLEAASNPSKMDRLRTQIKSRLLFILGTSSRGIEDDDGTETEVQVQIYGKNIDGMELVPAFASELRIQEFIRTSQPYISLTGQELLALLEPNFSLVINPSSAWERNFFPLNWRPCVSNSRLAVIILANRSNIPHQVKSSTIISY